MADQVFTFAFRAAIATFLCIAAAGLMVWLWTPSASTPVRA